MSVTKGVPRALYLLSVRERKIEKLRHKRLERGERPYKFNTDRGALRLFTSQPPPGVSLGERECSLSLE